MQVRRLSAGPRHHFYGYYGINPWDRAIRGHLALETRVHDRRPDVGDRASVGLVDRHTGAFTPFAVTSAFNLQQGSMMHWIDAGFGEEFTHNDWSGGRLVSRVIDPRTRAVRTIDGAIAAVSPDQAIAIGLNYARMAHCRPVVGYANSLDLSALPDAPSDDGLWRLNLRSGASRLVLSIADAIEASGDPEVRGRRAWFNHVLFNPDGSRLLFFCRVTQPSNRFASSLWTVDPDGSNLHCQIPFGHRVSHFAWRDTRHILISTDVLGQMGFAECTDGRRDLAPVGQGILPADGHACYSPDRRWIVTDTSARHRGRDVVRELMLYSPREQVKVYLGTYRADAQFVGDIRCDLHPRWSPDGQAITFDSVHEGTRQIYVVDVSEIVRH